MNPDEFFFTASIASSKLPLKEWLGQVLGDSPFNLANQMN
jgi:hypothetical protein